MANTGKLGVWIDHSFAHLTEFTADPMKTNTIESDFTYQDRQQTMARSENVMHNKEQQRHSEFYSKIAEEIVKYQEVVLFGPTDAKVELYNRIKADQRFAKTHIEVRQTDKMTEHQRQAFVREYFSKPAGPQ